MRGTRSAVLFALLTLIVAPTAFAADLALTPATPDPINCSQTVTVDFVYQPELGAPDLRGYNVHVRTWGAVLKFESADIADGVPFAPASSYFNTVSDGTGGWIVSSAQLGGLTGLDHEATLFSATFHVRSDSLIFNGTGHVKVVAADFRDLANNVIVVGTTGESIVPVDCFPPWWVTEIHAEPLNEGAVVTWTASTSTDVSAYEIWRGLWYNATPGVSAYPEYDDLANDVIPARPGIRANAAASAEWTLAGSVDGATLTFTDTSTPRGVYYYEIYAIDTADNYSFQAASNDRATNYWLGDVEPYADGEVETADIGILGASFGEVEGGPEIELPGPPDPSTVFHIDPVNLTLVGEIVVHSEGEYVGVNSKTGRAYHASQGTGEVAVIDGSTNTAAALEASPLACRYYGVTSSFPAAEL